MTKKKFHLSVVATSRNDDHGGHLLNRMQQFIDGFVIQCKRHRLNAELILVEWNPPPDRKSLAEALRFPADKGPCAIRIITVSPQLHATLQQADRLPLFQMIAKNVGIRRAYGRYVLATNIDILFSDETIKFIRQKLKPGRLYRVDRADVPMDTQVYDDFDQTLLFCEKNKFRIHGKRGSYIKVNNRWEFEITSLRKKRLKKLLRHSCRLYSSLVVAIPHLIKHFSQKFLVMRRYYGFARIKKHPLLMMRRVVEFFSCKISYLFIFFFISYTSKFLYL